MDRQKKCKFLPDIPSWELDSGFIPFGGNSRQIEWVNYRGERPKPLAPLISAEDVASGSSFDLEDLRFRDPTKFVAGNLHSHAEEWSKINTPKEVLDWISAGVKIEAFLKPFQGQFKGRYYHSDVPPAAYFPNADNCSKFSQFIADTLTERIENGSLSVIGKVGECNPPHLVLPLTVESSKPRLCHDERFLNLWIRDSPFHLDTLREVPRVIQRNAFMVALDDKSGYDHIFLHPDSRKYVGLQFAGWYMVFNVIPFGFKASAYIYHTTGLAPISYCRQLGVPCLLYIDDRMLSEFLDKQKSLVGSKHSALRSLFITCQVLTS